MPGHLVSPDRRPSGRWLALPDLRQGDFCFLLSVLPPSCMWGLSAPPSSPGLSAILCPTPFDFCSFRSDDSTRQGIRLCVSRRPSVVWGFCPARQRMTAWVHPRLLGSSDVTCTSCTPSWTAATRYTLEVAIPPGWTPIPPAETVLDQRKSVNLGPDRHSSGANSTRPTSMNVDGGAVWRYTDLS